MRAPEAGAEALPLKNHGNRAEEPAEIFGRHFDTIFRYFSRRVATPEDVEDLTAETFLVLYHRRIPKGVDALCFLYGVARRKLADHYRRVQRDRRLAGLRSPLEDVGGRVEAVQIRVLMDGLPSAQREALMLQALEQLSIEEIARVMGRSEKSVKALLQRAKCAIRLQMPEAEDFEVNP